MGHKIVTPVEGQTLIPGGPERTRNFDDHLTTVLAEKAGNRRTSAETQDAKRTLRLLLFSCASALCVGGRFGA